MSDIYKDIVVAPNIGDFEVYRWQRIAIYIAIYRWPSISRVFRHIVVYLLYIEGKSGQYIDVVVLVKA